jgi:hypothetical protein
LYEAIEAVAPGKPTQGLGGERAMWPLCEPQRFECKGRLVDANASRLLYETGVPARRRARPSVGILLPDQQCQRERGPFPDLLTTRLNTHERARRLASGSQ